MTTLNEDLTRMYRTMRMVCQSPVEVVNGFVYVDFGHLEAITLEPVLDQSGKHWVICVTKWDASGGVDDELELGVVREEYVPGVVRLFLEEQERRDQEVADALPNLEE
jgi:hypothetical protein